eukprot:6487453-Amphidinium_carterae.1
MSVVRATAAGSVGSLSFAAFVRWVLHHPVFEEQYSRGEPYVPSVALDDTQTCLTVSSDQATVAVVSGAFGFCAGFITGVTACVFLVGGAFYLYNTHRPVERQNATTPLFRD